MPEKVKIYSTPECPFCKAAKEFFDKEKIEFEDIDVSSNKKATEEMIKISGQMSVPVIVIGNEVVVGFDKEKIESLLKK